MNMAMKIVERSSVSPSDEGGAAEQTLPLVYFDMVFLQAPPMETLYFYDIKCSESCFLETFVVKLKQSLSITLKHFLPLASKIVFPLSSDGIPVSRYAAGDSVAVTVAVSGADFANLTGNHPRAADEFHDYVMQLPPAVYSSDDVKFSPMAIQVTLFPNQGVCIGFTHHHAICDVTSFIAFVHAWASIHRFNGEDVVQLPFYGRGFVQDAKLERIGWKKIWKTSKPTVSLTNSPLPTHKLRATFILSDAQIGKLKKFTMIKNAGMGRVSSFVVVCAYLWSCLAKSAAAVGEEVADDEPEHFISPVECRARLNPPLPETYFGNCLVLLRAESSHGRLKGSEGFSAAVEAIAPVIGSTNLINGEWIMEFFENQFRGNSEYWSGKRRLWIAGSSRIDHYGADYGWGRGIKYECIHTDFNGSVNLCKAREGGIEIGLSMPKLKMDAFADIFHKYLCITSNL